MIATTPTFADPRLSEKVVQDIRLDLRSELAWISKDFGIARIGIAETEEKGVYPQITNNDGTGEHQDLRPDNKEKGFFFFELDDYTPDFEEMETIYSMSLVFFTNLKLIDASKLYDFSFELIEEVILRLRTFEAQNIIVHRGHQDVFNRYAGVNELLTEFAMKPFSVFRIEFDINRLICHKPLL